MLLKRFRQSVLAKAFRGELVEHDPNDEPASALLERIKAEREKKKVAGKKYVEPVSVDTSELPELPEGWEWVSLDELSYHVTSGSRGWAKYYAESGNLFIRVGDFNRLSIDLDLKKVAFVDAPESAEAERTRLRDDDILITMTADVGMIGVVKHSDLGSTSAYINQHVGLVRPVSKDIISFVAYALASEVGQKQFRDKQYGATKIGLGLDDLKGLTIPLAPLAEQRRIVAKIESLFAQADEIERAVEVARRRAEQIDQAILARAFRGGM